MPANATKALINEFPNVAEKILELIFERRRLLPDEASISVDESAETSHHIEKINNFIREQKPIHMILPAFPAKSPNRKKTLDIYPDKGEELALERLERLCRNIQKIYSPGAKLTICSDGRVFAEVVNIPDKHVTEYKYDLINRIASNYPETFDFFDLDDFYTGISNYDILREELMIEFGEPLRDLKERCKTEKPAAEMYKGICRFLVEDFSGLEEFEGYSKTQILNMARVNAYRVIQRSNAWTRLLAQKFEKSIRLSIHPQPKVSEKIGIYLLEADNVWRTPWHSVVIHNANGYTLVPRHIAESKNALLVFENGRPSHFKDTHA
ncbi:Pyoverdine/dityrosine biosynthesis protein Dit1 (Dit1) (PDB:3E59) (PUBMED:18156253) [Commensalibacter communis]|uniref:Pyoverdine/dityrosine biosynthesis protein Dit1 (Dit1) n=1 Tax=Commensalibacter communis TaxID=2972786 RepID=A0A9W4TPK9_9PROT|nr:isocyanide synthase family protein [Commensalibacter communis]CAI3937754.1 Pyoverdine/dityrosine biosynthesis protein Dit1 (Dit1) (PDB:3E59) (PUBMED:18156253) [Commensalibacter communis]CAI3939698.1 Pyoverdine/dityrosine biosynthesis protein Dit1 (Dit1) (PDB:3E59) (PUBMED:18156253) [Commensalibacter communis]CAI3940476.1 Pyoverdine/dityrosine biosynthesis protein Dit1 (Dit1) (PDB:3E59) (PUBMED:18156253) [Commensalibacter communis]CAI3940661.1 Pyoverdine/dityrosine biosynthesis protein Dit1 (